MILDTVENIGLGMFCIAVIAFLIALGFLLASLFIYSNNRNQIIRNILIGVLVLIFLLLIETIYITFIALLITVVVYFIYKDKPFRKPLKIGLISLLISGISLLLTSVLCGWY